MQDLVRISVSSRSRTRSPIQRIGGLTILMLAVGVLAAAPGQTAVQQGRAAAETAHAGPGNPFAVAPTASRFDLGPGQAAATEPASTSRAGGQHEGVTVHGHWVIEVKKPDGRLLSRAVFENSLYGSGGGVILPLFLAQNGSGSGLNSYTPGEWGIQLSDPKSPPCSAGFTAPFNDGVSQNYTVGPINGPSCILTQKAPPAALYTVDCGSGNAGCSYNLGLQAANLSTGGLVGDSISVAVTLTFQ